jgi:hypothetical protein
MMKAFIIIVIFCIIGVHHLHAQYAPQVGINGTTAISKDESAIVAWADACIITCGWQNIADQSLGLTTVGNETSAKGVADGDIVSLGDGGAATLTFTHPIYNGPGADFAVFENGFNAGGAGLAFLEFAFVEVSSDGINFVRFPAHSHVQDTAQLPMDPIDCSLVHNLAGTYIFGYGTPFDLQDVADSNGLDVNNITHVRLIDVVGSIDEAYATYDVEGNKINDPWPTPYPSSGFDLDAVGVLHAAGLTGVDDVAANSFNIYPNPVAKNKLLHTGIRANITIYNLQGEVVVQLINENTVELNDFAAGCYIIELTTNHTTHRQKLLVVE